MHIHIPLSLSLWYFPFLHPFLFTSMMANHQSAHTPSNRLYSQIYLRAFGQLIKLVGNELHLVPERNYWPRLNVTGEIIISQKGLTSGNIANRISSSVRNYGRDNIGNIKPRLVATGGARPFLLFFSFFLFFFFFFSISGCRRWQLITARKIMASRTTLYVFLFLLFLSSLFVRQFQHAHPPPMFHYRRVLIKRN